MRAPHDLHGPRARGLPVLLAPIVACTGRGAEAANQAVENFGEAMHTVVLILLVFAAIGAACYVATWAWLVTSWRRGRASRAAAILLVLTHAGALLMAGDEPGHAAHAWLWWSAPLPAAALAIAFAARLRARVAIFAATTAGLCLLPAEPPPLTALPAPVAALSSAFIDACVVLDSGDVVCAGDEGCGEDEFSPASFRPRQVTALSDADQVHSVSGLTCVRRRAGPAVCCGGAQSMPDPRTSRGPWEVPIGGPGSAFAVSPGQILARTGDALQAWPHPLPPGLGSARALAVNEGLEDHFAVVDREGELWMWQQDGARISRITRFPGLADAVEVALQPRTGACVRRTSGAVACFPWPDSGDAPFDVPDLRAAQLIALDDAFDSFCVRTPEGAVLCWSENDPPRPFAALPHATRLVSTNSALCDLAAAPRCVPVMHDVDRPLAELLALPVAR